MPQPRTKYDIAALAGYGFPVCVPLYCPVFAPNATGLDAAFAPTEFASDKTGAALRLSSAQVVCGTPGNQTGGNYVFTLTLVDTNNNVLGTAGTLVVAANTPPTLFDLRDASGKGISLPAGIGVRLDTGAGATGGSTNGGMFRVRLFGECYGAAV